MAKIYGTPIGGGGTGTNTTLPPLLDNFKAKAKGNISKKGHGEAVNIIDSIESELNGLKLYGKSTQDGTPTSETPIPIVSAGDNGTITVTVSDGAEQSQTLPVTTPNGLLGIPVTSGSNYTDADGQQWVCDEVDFARGKYVQRFKMLEFDGTEDWKRHSTDAENEFRFYLDNTGISRMANSDIIIRGLSTHYEARSARQTYVRSAGFSSSIYDEIAGSPHLYIYDANHNTTVEDWKSYLAAQKTAGTPVKVVYELETPVETDIPEETIEAYKSLTTYAPETNIMTDSTPAAGIEIEYASTTMNVELSADKISENRGQNLLGAVWVYADHEPTSVNDGTKIQLAREEVVTSDGDEAQTVTKTVEWNIEADFFARQFTYNSKKQYQTMLEGAIATITLVGVPAPVSELAETHSGSSITLTWNNPTSDELYDHTVVVYKTDAFPTAIDDGTQGYSGTDETATLSGLELGSTYYIAVFTVSAYGLYGEPQTVQVEFPAGLLISSLASGTKVKLGKWNNTDLQWKVARDTSDQSIRLVLEPTSVSLLGNKMWDNKEPSNYDSSRRSYGNNRYIYSNIHQWLNATKATEWYTAQHSADAAPDYSSQAGFLSGWSENHIAALDRAMLTVSRSRTDGGGTETFVARVALISTSELGLQSGTGGGRLDIFNSDGDRSTGRYYWTRTPNPSNSDGAYQVSSAGVLIIGYSVYNANGVRPLCIPVSTALVSLGMDDDNCYVVQ